MNYHFEHKRYQEMKYNVCGQSGLVFPAISLGTWQYFGDDNNHTESEKILTTAFDLGITHIDAANNYGPPAGSAESTLGRLLKKNFQHHRDELIISTKAGYRMWDGPYGEFPSRKNIIASADQSLTRLQLEYVDIFYIHRDEVSIPMEEMIGALSTLVKQGKTLYGAISNFSPERTVEAQLVAQQMGVPLIAHQYAYSLLNRNADNALHQTLQRVGLGGVAYSTLAQGVLSGKYLSGIPSDSRAANDVISFLTKEKLKNINMDKVAQLKKIADARGQSLANFATQWALSQDAVTTVLIGVSKAEQLIDTMSILSAPEFTASELQLIDDITLHQV